MGAKFLGLEARLYIIKRYQDCSRIQKLFINFCLSAYFKTAIKSIGVHSSSFSIFALFNDNFFFDQGLHPTVSN